MQAPDAPRVVIFGDGRLSRAIERRLAERGCLAERHALRETTDLEALDLAHVAAVALAADDDTENVDLAITLRAMRPTLRLVVRMFDPTLAAYLQRTLQNVVVTNMTDAAAPAFVGAVLDGIEQRPFTRPVALPKPRTLANQGFDRLLTRTAISTLVVMVLATLFFRQILHLDTISAFYFVGSTITTVGYGDISLHHAPWFAKLAGIALMFAGPALSTVAFALLTEWLLDRRIDELEGRSGVRWRDHAIVVGGGNIGYRVAALLRRRGMRVVVIEKDGSARHVLGARADGDHVIVGDALSDGILELASIAGAAAVVAVTNSDAVNLHVAIAAKALAPNVAVAMRIVSPVLSAHVSETHEAVAISPLAVTSDVFVDALTSPAADGVAKAKP
jgi:Trk K+ transport system NAD-binding subunit